MSVKEHLTFSRIALPAAALAVGFFANQVIAAMEAPTEHKGLAVEALGVIDEANMSQQIGLSGHKLQLRAITIEPGGQIAKHSHETRPGLVKVVSGSWIEGRPSGEMEYSAASEEGILEDKDTVHWFYNRGDEPATAIVCDIVPAG
jgi:quercetin dioxygenase-like cupin family protein